MLEYVPETVYSEARKWQKSKQALPIMQVKLYLYQLCRALGQIHALGICHRDIKPQVGHWSQWSMVNGQRLVWIDPRLARRRTPRPPPPPFASRRPAPVGLRATGAALGRCVVVFFSPVRLPSSPVASSSSRRRGLSLPHPPLRPFARFSRRAASGSVRRDALWLCFVVSCAVAPPAHRRATRTCFSIRTTRSSSSATLVRRRSVVSSHLVSSRRPSRLVARLVAPPPRQSPAPFSRDAVRSRSGVAPRRRVTAHLGTHRGVERRRAETTRRRAAKAARRRDRSIERRSRALTAATPVVSPRLSHRAQTLVAGEPNVSYICSRYYRAPELIFGSTNYTTAIDIWSQVKRQTCDFESVGMKGGNHAPATGIRARDRDRTHLLSATATLSTHGSLVAGLRRGRVAARRAAVPGRLRRRPARGDHQGAPFFFVFLENQDYSCACFSTVANRYRPACGTSS